MEQIFSKQNLAKVHKDIGLSASLKAKVIVNHLQNHIANQLADLEAIQILNFQKAKVLNVKECKYQNQLKNAQLQKEVPIQKREGLFKAKIGVSKDLQKVQIHLDRVAGMIGKIGVEIQIAGKEGEIQLAEAESEEA